MPDGAVARKESPLGILRVLRRRYPAIALCVLVAGGSAYALSSSQEDEYSASAQLLFRRPGLDQNISGAPVFSGSADPDREGATNAKLVSLPVIAERAAGRLRLPDAGSVLGKVRVEQDGQSDIVSVVATDRDPKVAARLANTFSREYIAFRKRADRSKAVDAQRLVGSQLRAVPRSQRKSARARRLRRQLEQLGVVASLQTGNAELVQRASPPGAPSSPRPIRSAILGSVLGLLIGLGIALLLERLDRRLKEVDEISEQFGLPVLSVVPKSKTIGPPGSSTAPPGEGEAEAFRMLSANLRYFNVDRDISSIILTSAAPGDGKSTVAWHLAQASASSGLRTLLIEADLRHPVFAARYEAPGHGLTNVLAGDLPAEQATQEVAPGLHLLVAGGIPPNPAALLDSATMRELLDGAEKRYDLVIVDAPPTPLVADAIPLCRQVSGVIVVARPMQTTRDGARRLCHQLKSLGAPTLGVVVNGYAHRPGVHDPYMYGYEGSTSAVEEATAAPVITRSPPQPSWDNGAGRDGEGIGLPRDSAPTGNGADRAPAEPPREAVGTAGGADSIVPPAGGLTRLRQRLRR